MTKTRRRISNVNDDIATSPPTICWGKYSRYSKSRRKKVDADDALAYEKSLINDRGFSYIIGSDESGRGSIAGPVVTASCCIVTLADSYRGTETPFNFSDLPTGRLMAGFGGGIKDSKQLTAEEREQIYQAIVDNPEIYAFSVAQRSNTEIDNTNNILTSTMESFRESIKELVEIQLHRHLLPSQQQSQQKDILAYTSNGNNTDINNKIYSIVDGKKAPKLSTSITSSSLFPCRPMVKADVKVYTVALASIIAKVTHDRMADEWHDLYPNYGFRNNKGYATRSHIEAIHRFGPCPLHRRTFKSLKGRQIYLKS